MPVRYLGRARIIFVATTLHKEVDQRTSRQRAKCQKQWVDPEPAAHGLDRRNWDRGWRRSAGCDRDGCVSDGKHASRSRLSRCSNRCRSAQGCRGCAATHRCQGCPGINLWSGSRSRRNRGCGTEKQRSRYKSPNYRTRPQHAHYDSPGPDRPTTFDPEYGCSGPLRRNHIPCRECF